MTRRGELTGNFMRKSDGKVFRGLERPGELLRPKGDWPDKWVDSVHEHDGHGVDAEPLDRSGENILDAHLNSLYMQNGIQCASDDVSGANLDVELVKAGRAVEITRSI